jgi:hypothetical protein
MPTTGQYKHLETLYTVLQTASTLVKFAVVAKFRNI